MTNRAFKRLKRLARLLAYLFGCCLLVPAIVLMFEWHNVGPALRIVGSLRRKTWGKQIEAAEINTHLKKPTTLATNLGPE